MARFRGTVRGGRGTGSRLGHASTGLHLHANSWSGSVEVELYVREHDDWARVLVTTGDGKSVQLWHGPLYKYVNPRLARIEFIPLWDEKKEK